ncbi:MAG: heavy-metal-associated domain-containing protein [Clostridia bacterium]|nr:heavy-metal-associated domain-containing protein [Clostridia bacterium]
MTDIIIIAVVIVIAAIGIRSTITHFKGQGGCCGGGDYKPRKKKLKNILYTKTFTVDGMHCDHCKNRVEEVVNDMAGIAGKVDLKKGELTVSYAEKVNDERIIARIEKAGYTVTGCKG